MSFFKIGGVHQVGSGDETVTQECGRGIELVSGSNEPSASYLSKAWGVMRGSASGGTVVFDTSGSMLVADMAAGEVVPCFPRSVTAVSGSVYILF